MTIITPRHQKQRPGLTSRIAPAITARHAAVLGGVAVAAPATALSVLAAPADALTVHSAHAAGGAIKAAPAGQDVTWVRYGDSGDLVKVVQQRLGGIAVDGNFGSATLAKVKAFQKTKGLYVDGQVGPNTWRALGGFPTSTTPTKPPTTTNPAPTNVTWVRYGDHGALVKVVQQRLGGITIDGSFGNATLAKVKSFQKAKALYVDGVVGPNTWQALGGYPKDVPSDPPTTPDPPNKCEVTTLRYGSGGELVQVLQRRIGGVAVDGSFGNATLARVKAYQSSKGLPSTGVVDAATWSALGGFPCDVQNPQPPTDPGQTTNKGQEIISIAKQYLGVPYVWGGASPSGFDCSGLTQYVYAKAGIKIPRVAHSQQDFLKPTSSPQPGDLVFFGTPAYHVGIYLGNNTQIAAPYPGQVVRIQPIYSTPSGYGTYR